MDVRLHLTGAWPEHMTALLAALEALPETADAPDGEVVFCPDATAFAPPTEPADAIVAGIAQAERLFVAGERSALVGSLAPWAEAGALFFTPTAAAAVAVRGLLDLAPERVRVVPLPLAPERVPAAAEQLHRDVLAVAPIAYQVLLPALRLLRLGGLEPRLLLADPGSTPWVRPGGLASAEGLLPGREVVAVADWRAAVASASVITLFDAAPGDGWTLREALATGRAVVVPSSSVVRDHLATIGAGAYLYSGVHDVAGLATTLAAALRRDRGEGLERAARDAVLAEAWPDAARTFFGVLRDALAPPPQRAAAVRFEVARERLAVTVLNPHASGGGGERFMRQLVHAFALHHSAPQVKLVCAVEPHTPFDTGTRALEHVGVEVRTVPGADFERVAAQELAGSDVVYYSWPHLADPPAAPTPPLVCTFHDLNWKHFDVYGPPDKAILERQTARWIERASAIVHSSQFIRGELQHYYGAPESLTRVIALTAERPAEPATRAERDGVRRRFALPERFLLSPAGCHLHKNYPALDAALRLLRRDGRPVTVVASGDGTEVNYHGPDLIGLGYIGSRELQALYEDCDGIVQTTLYEAGSFPMLEAMVVGKPVAISRIAPVMEQIEREGIVAELFDPLDPEDIARALGRLWEGSPATHPDVCAANAAAVAARTWDDVAADYLSVFEMLRSANGAQAP
jgi:glycosyltransferase involved in cell wall biosynthesis